MKLTIRNLAKIKDATLNFDGITIIVGDNNTGKSTVGKVLYAIFNSMLHFKERVLQDRYWSCRQVISEVLPRVIRRRVVAERTEGDVISDFLAGRKTDAEIKYVLDTLAKARGVDVDSSRMMDELREIREPSDAVMQNRLVRNYFSSVFNGQYISLYSPKKGALVQLTLKGQDIRVMLRKSTTNYKSATEIKHPAYYIDTPSLIHSIAGEGFGASKLGSSLSSAIREGWSKLPQNDRSVVTEVVNDLKLRAIYEKLQDVLGGRLAKNEGGEIVFRIGKGKDHFDLDLENMSQGVKSFGLLFAAIKSGAIGRRDVLILDEPEIHLHPEWQIRYAELIVLIQQAFDLTVLLTSHSADFIQAIRLFAKRHGTFNGVNAYVTESMPSGYVKVNPVSHENWDAVFSRFEGAFNTLIEVEAKLQEDGE